MMANKFAIYWLFFAWLSSTLYWAMLYKNHILAAVCFVASCTSIIRLYYALFGFIDSKLKYAPITGSIWIAFGIFYRGSNSIVLALEITISASRFFCTYTG